MGGPGGVTGQPSTWITQLVASLPGQTGDPDRLVFLADAHAGSFVRDIHTQRACRILLRVSGSQSVAAPQALSRFVASALSARVTPCWIGSVALSVSRTHVSINTQAAAAFPLGRRGACCPSSVSSSSLSPPSFLLWSLGPVSLAPSPCQQPYGYHPNPPPLAIP